MTSAIVRAAKARSHACEPVYVVDPVFEQAGPAVHEVVGDAAGPDAKGHVVEERHSPASSSEAKGRPKPSVIKK